MSYYQIIVDATSDALNEYQGTRIGDQIHFMLDFLPELDGVLCCAEWDGTSPYVIQHKGDYSARNMGYAGWPDITAEQWVSQQADQMGVS